jgi:acetylornithine deacetylase/succinyl-diaminopimelate desuccinylase-like protein
MVSAGHAPNALPQKATATVNCRIFPGTSREEVRQTLAALINDPKVSISAPRSDRSEAEGPAPPLTPAITGPIEQLTAQMWPGVPVAPVLQAAATDGKALTAAGIPTYGVSGLFYEPDLGHIHGLNERIGVTSLMEGRAFLYRLVKVYAESPS